MATFESNGSNGHIPHQTTVDDHFAYFRYLYDIANENWYVQKAKQTLRLGNVLDPIEHASQVGINYSAPLYETYLYPTTDYILHQYIVPGVENSKQVLEKSKDAASTGGTYSLNLAVIATQVGLIASAATTALLLDGLILTKKSGLAVAGGAISLEKSIEQRILQSIERSRNLAKVPVEKFNEYANSFIDIVNVVLDNHLHLPIEEEGEAETSNIPQRVSRLTRRVLYALKNRTNENLIQPVQNQLKVLTEQLQKSLHLVDILKQQRHQFQSSVSDLKNKLSSESVQELWNRVQAEASEFKITPEDALIRSIKRCSFILNDYLKKLRQQTNEILPAPVAEKLDLSAAYVEELNSNLENSNSIYDVKDEVLQKAKQTLEEITAWTASFRKNSDASDSTDTIDQSPVTIVHPVNGSLVSNDSFANESHDTSGSFSSS